MRQIKLYIIILLTGILLLACNDSSTSPEDNEVLKVACVGDSITEGYGLDDPKRTSYPAQLQNLLGTGWKVDNFGISGATVLKKGNRPYWSTSAFEPSHTTNPDIVIIMLGTNDAKPANWRYSTDFITDYSLLISTYKNLPSSPKIYICFPPPVYGTPAGITNQRIKNELIPKIKEIARQTDTKIIDIYTAMSDKPELFPDTIHPNADGTKQIAHIVYKEIAAE